VCHSSGQPLNGPPAYADFGLAPHLAKESVSVYTTDHVRFSKIKLTKSVSLKRQLTVPACCQGFCGQPRRHLRDRFHPPVLSLCFSILLLRASSIALSKVRMWSRSAFILAAWVGSSGPEEPREAGLSGSLVIRKTSPRPSLTGLDDCSKCTAGSNLANPGNPDIVTWARQAGSGFPENPSAMGAIEWSARSSQRQGAHNWLDPLGFSGGVLGPEAC
jgi:hypothetical protein